jgi:ribosomal protein L10
MKTIKRQRISETKLSILKNNLMNRFIREIEREEPLEMDVRNTMLAYQPNRVR